MTPAAITLQAQSSAPAPLGKLVDLGGRRLHLYCQGSGSPTVVVENGNSGFSIDWALVQPDIAKVTRICTYDRAGNAWSEKGPANGSVAEIVDDLHLLLRTAVIRPPYVLVGASIGGIYVRAYQRRYPDQVVGLLLDDPTSDEGFKYMVNGKDTPIYEMTGADMRGAFKPLLSNPPHYNAPTEVQEPYDRLPAQLRPIWLWAAQKYFADMDIINDMITADSWRDEFIALRRQRLASAHALGSLPLIVLGRHQGDWENRLRDLNATTALSSRGKLIIAENSGHAIQLYRPDLVKQAIREVVSAVRRKHGPSAFGSTFSSGKH